MELYNDNCFNIFPEIQDKHIDLFVLDLPYANFKFGKCTACKWDIPIDLDEMWKHIKRIMKPNAVIVFFCNTKFGYALIDSNPKWFKYDLIYKKGNKKVGFLSANKQPLRQHENIYVFDNPENEEYNDLELNRNLDLRNYAEKVFKFIGKSLKNINKDLGHFKLVHFHSFKISQFALPILETYNELIEKYKINEMEGFLEYDILKDSWEKSPPKIHSTYNSQKTEGKEIKMKRKVKCKNVYGDLKLPSESTYKDRHPTSILPDIELEEHENVYVFDNTNNDDLELNRNLDLRNYAEKVFKFIGKSRKQIDKDLKSEAIARFYGFKNTQFKLPILETYNELIEKYKINEMEGFLEYDILKDSWEKEPSSTYNPQKTEGKPYILNEVKPKGKTQYGNQLGIKEKRENKGDRHPTSILPDIKSTILDFTPPHKTIHRTQKPEKLLEWLIKTYSNEEDTVMDFCMGSGTAGVACKNTNRKFIGVEMDKEIYDLAYDRIHNT